MATKTKKDKVENISEPENVKESEAKEADAKKAAALLELEIRKVNEQCSREILEVLQKHNRRLEISMVIKQDRIIPLIDVTPIIKK